MTRFNYLAASDRPSFATRLSVVAIDNRIRGPLAALLATVVLTATLCAVQLIRLHAAQGAFARASTRLAALDAAVRDVQTLRGRVNRRSGLAHYVAGVQQASLAHTNELTWIGNRIPPQTWLRSLRFEAGRYTLEGSCARPSAVSVTMLALRDEARSTIPQLVSLHDDRSAAATRIRFTLQLQTQ